MMAARFSLSSGSNGICSMSVEQLMSKVCSPITALERAKPEHPGRWFGPLAFHQTDLEERMSRFYVSPRRVQSPRHE